MAKNPREPKAVKKLIADATERQVAAQHLSWLKRLLTSDRAARAERRNGGGTRKHPRDGQR